MKKIVISGDIIAYTSLSIEEKNRLNANLNTLNDLLKKEFNAYTRIIKGDYLECVVSEPWNSFRVALIIKSFLKYKINDDATIDAENKRKKYHKNYGIRLALGFGELLQLDSKKGIIDGEAIYISGRLINEENTHKGSKIFIKNTMFFGSNDAELNAEINTIMQLLDYIINKATGKQCEVLFYKLLGENEEEISKKIGVSQPVINKHSTNIGWNVIEKAILYLENKLSELCQ
jgi:hypothetical protein